MDRFKALAGECGSYTIEACVSLVTFIIAIAFVYSQVQVVICENIMQHAVNHMALEVSTYSYVLDRMGIVRHDDGSAQTQIDGGVQGMIDSYTETAAGFSKFTQSNSVEQSVQAGQEVIESGKGMIESIQKMFSLITAENLENSLQEGGDSIAELLGNTVLNSADGYYNWKLDEYLPCDRETFIKRYNIDSAAIWGSGDNTAGGPFDFSLSSFMPGGGNTTILVAVRFNIKSRFSLFPIDRTIVKRAYTAVWLADPDFTHE